MFFWIKVTISDKTKKKLLFHLSYLVFYEQLKIIYSLSCLETEHLPYSVTIFFLNCKETPKFINKNLKIIVLSTKVLFKLGQKITIF